MKCLSPLFTCKLPKRRGFKGGDVARLQRYFFRCELGFFGGNYWGNWIWRMRKRYNTLIIYLSLVGVAGPTIFYEKFGEHLCYLAVPEFTQCAIINGEKSDTYEKFDCAPAPPFLYNIIGL